MRTRMLFTAVMLLILLSPTGTAAAFPHGQEEPVDEICPHWFVLDLAGAVQRIPICLTSSMNSEETMQIQRAVIVIHGANRTAVSYYDSVVDAAVSAGASLKTTLILAPQFLIPEDIQQHAAGESWSDVLYWSYGGWKRGDLSLASPLPRSVQASSFSVMDLLLNTLADPMKFPALETVVVIGHSAGGQFVQRYAAGGRGQQDLAEQGISIQFAAANPSTYLYLDNRRFTGGSGNLFSVPQSLDCPGYNDYKYGLDNLNNYLAETGAEAIHTAYPERHITYLLGEEDNDPEADLLDTGCEATLQGANRLERGLIFYEYLQNTYGETIRETQQVAVIPGVGHSSSGIFHSIAAVQLMFGMPDNAVSDSSISRIDGTDSGTGGLGNEPESTQNPSGKISTGEAVRSTACPCTTSAAVLSMVVIVVRRMLAS